MDYCISKHICITTRVQTLTTHTHRPTYPPPHTHTHTHTAGTPGLVRFPISLADTQTQVFISWFPPVDLNVIDPLLLRYELYYRQGTSFDESTAQKVTDIPPLLLSSGVSPEGVVETTLSSLQPGTTYTLTVQAVSSAGSGELLGDRVIVTTFGNGMYQSCIML